MDRSRQPVGVHSAVGLGLLCILWGVTLLFKSIPFGIGLLGTGLILFSANLMRARRGKPADVGNTVLGILTVCWGLLELARPTLQGLFVSADLDWAIFAILLVILGIVLIVRALLRMRNLRARDLDTSS
jgi:hypothetical protein